MKIYVKSAVSNLSNQPLDDRQDIALDPNTTVDVLEQLAEDKDPSVRLCLICNEATPSYIIDKLLSEGSPYFLEQVALCLSTPENILARLSESEHAVVRSRVAWNTHTPSDILAKLSNDENTAVIWNVAGNKSTPVDTLIKLSNHPDANTRGEVASNPSTPINILLLLLNDSSDIVRSIAKRARRQRYD